MRDFNGHIILCPCWTFWSYGKFDLKPTLRPRLCVYAVICISSTDTLRIKNKNPTPVTQCRLSPLICHCFFCNPGGGSHICIRPIPLLHPLVCGCRCSPGSLRQEAEVACTSSRSLRKCWIPRPWECSPADQPGCKCVRLCVYVCVWVCQCAGCVGVRGDMDRCCCQDDSATPRRKIEERRPWQINLKLSRDLRFSSPTENILRSAGWQLHPPSFPSPRLPVLAGFISMYAVVLSPILLCWATCWGFTTEPPC